jgi:hypothetical protein
VVIWAFARAAPAIAATSAMLPARAIAARALRNERHDEQRFMVIDETLWKEAKTAGGMRGVSAILAHLG